ncbi:MAG TPA: ATPase domain-containing protein [Dehalococcoidia bacterium]|nr:ATPase domain-containing protein [Dehalococcoidia bacterium]
MRTTIGVEGIDALIEGGVPRGAAVLVSGEAGTGKSVLCIQFILSGIREGEPGVFATTDHPNRILEQAASLGWDLRGAVEDGFARVVQIGADAAPIAPPAAAESGDAEGAGPGEGAGSGAGGGPGAGGEPGAGGGPDAEAPGGDTAPAGGAVDPGERVAAVIAAAASEINAERVAIDPPLLAGSPDVSADSSFVASLLRASMRATHATTLITGLRVHGETGFTRLGIEEQVVDGIVDLRIDESAGRRTRVVAIHEMHGTRTNLDDHMFAILPGRGMVVGEA